MFVAVALIIAGACALISIRTLIGYGEFSLLAKVSVSFVILCGWLAPLWENWLRRHDVLSPDVFRYVSQAGYFLFGAVFILFALLLARDIFWYLIYGMGKLSGRMLLPSPSDIKVLASANLATVVLTLALSFYAYYEAVKIPGVKTVEFSTEKTSDSFSIVHLTDLHINRTSSLSDLQKLVDKVNALSPDIIVLTGDIADDKAAYVEGGMHILSKLKSKYGTYYSIGNHEVYSGILPILERIRDAGINVLYNRGVALPDLNVFISGIPDLQNAGGHPLLMVDMERTLDGSTEGNYRILLSHRPDAREYTKDGVFDLQLSGHTHGGQIFPFHILAARSNRYLAGSYRDNEMDIYVSRGAGYWGPPLRLLAPSEITLIKINPLVREKVSRNNKVTTREMAHA